MSTENLGAPTGFAAPLPSNADSDVVDRLADLRRRRAEVVDVLAETLMEQVLRAPRGPRYVLAVDLAKRGPGA
jgi:hypothetical protein